MRKLLALLGELLLFYRPSRLKPVLLQVRLWTARHEQGPASKMFPFMLFVFIS
jgi:hypothetical protein